MATTAAATPASITPTSTANGYLFLDQMMDKYATGSTPRLVQSFVPDSAMGSFTDSVTYDDALVIDALLTRGTADDLARAKVIGNALLYVQANDKSKDGRIRAAYAPTPLTSPSKVSATDDTSDVGNMAWVGQALVQLYAKTADASYLTGATNLATWIQTNAYATNGPGGYTGGYDSSGKLTWKSTEHNLDVYALFAMLATETGDSTWTTRAAHAKSFVAAMWDSTNSKYWVGTNPDGTSLNKGFLPEDVNTWTYLAFKDPARAASIDWDVTNLAATDGAFSGVSFGACDKSKVWFEGTAHLADALAIRNGGGDATKAQNYLNAIQLAQTTAPHNNGKGIVAASHDKLSDCDSDYYYAAPHTGATSWYLLAATATDPFYLLPSSSVGNDFTLSASPASATTTAGSTSSTTVTTALTSGTAEPVALSTSGLPSGATATFAPASITAGGTSTLTITTAANTSAGTYPITITGATSSATHSTTFTLTVTGTTTGPTLYEAESTANTITAPASVITCTACSGGARVGHIGKQSTGTGTLQFNGIVAPDGAGTYQITVAFTDGSASRAASISVNGGPAQSVIFGTTGSFSTPGNQAVALALAAGTNTITITNPSASAPDIDAITVPATHS
ncbi:CBM35 domain-containing protein [Catenulispora sp. GAS73]|uniref:CBM35 domain-containing protein n=1 Tax=Catenulispora sp. GAS73 TaxID=3156269 RepID=UPI003511672A